MTTLMPGSVFLRPSARILSAALLVGLMLSGCGASKPPQQGPRTASDATDVDRRASVRMELASGYFSRGQYDTALDELKQALIAKPDLPEAITLRSLIYAAMGEYNLAEEGFRKSLAQRPDGDTLHNYGWFLCQRQRYAEAYPQFEAAVADPKYRTPGRSWLAWGVCEAREGRLVPAQQHLAKAFEVEPGNPTISINLGEVLYRLGEYERARFYARRVNNNLEQANASSLWLELRIERRMGNTANMEDLGKQLRNKYPQAAETKALNSGRFDE
ncbi:type IV pilus biogenesis/stability protein PilW [Roseateles amylovorans]|uniref:Type IV pilus biogenesis/stability protein PilW n=1 Tax=Roseateles amylovorans TaxID=2978473 RepID=A0ABY6AXP1_9BURK|nr:type IV pilus biogenesis/stability protein PilW [Roseateles amylovorans]UXH77068.1 type IV pilus biogenesis/stability protein PilW [Roseateles amylovorans]